MKTSSPSAVSKSLFPLLLIALIFSALTLAPLARHARAQTGQKVAPAPANPAATDSSSAPKITYPGTKKVEQVDDYFGTKVPDPYRWLENENAPEVASWVESENQLTFSYLERIPYRQKIKDRLTQLLNYPKYTAPSRRGDYFFFTKNDGLQNQSVWYIQKGLDGTPEVLIDPNKLSPDGTSQLSVFSPSKDGKYLAYGISKGGSDWTELFLMDVASRQMLGDDLQWLKVSGVSWAGNGFFYSRYPAPEKGKELTSKNENHQVFFHRVGTLQAED